MTAAPRWARGLLREEDFAAIERAVQAAESATAGEIRVHLERRLARGRGREAPAALARARDVFADLGMHRTAARAGVLVYLAVEDRKVAIVGDEGIHAHVGDAGWAAIRDDLVACLRRGAAGEAIVSAVERVGATLARHFPRPPGDTNELSDQVSLE